MQIASIFFLVSAIFNTSAINVIMLLIGRLLLGARVGFGHLEFASMGMEKPQLALLERGKLKELKETLKKIRGIENVDQEFDELLCATELAKKVKHPFKSLMKCSSRPPFVCGTILYVLQQFTSINLIMFYVPVLFQMMGFKSDASLLSVAVIGFVNVLATLVAIALFDMAFLTLLCHMRAGIFLFFFAAWIVTMDTFGKFLMPKTRKIPIDKMNERVWKKHWFWKRFTNEDCDGNMKVQIEQEITLV
ncbi:hypothetical protein HHK36_013875 [Tetracentron sinense]|uniref:Uncharacterized protein n=1 Tax=Tetracentron sinense TaxID=13715 RepID=A0A835DEU2_TETSI|nr:hypothetical protein HHK36_013875 [Tetracentron sinense]